MGGAPYLTLLGAGLTSAEVSSFAAQKSELPGVLIQLQPCVNSTTVKMKRNNTGSRMGCQASSASGGPGRAAGVLESTFSVLSFHLTYLTQQFSFAVASLVNHVNIPHHSRGAPRRQRCRYFHPLRFPDAEMKSVVDEAVRTGRSRSYVNDRDYLQISSGPTALREVEAKKSLPSLHLHFQTKSFQPSLPTEYVT